MGPGNCHVREESEWGGLRGTSGASQRGDRASLSTSDSASRKPCSLSSAKMAEIDFLVAASMTWSLHAAQPEAQRTASQLRGGEGASSAGAGDKGTFLGCPLRAHLRGPLKGQRVASVRGRRARREKAHVSTNT